MTPITPNNNLYLDQYIPAEEPIAENAAYEDYLGSEQDFEVSEDVFIQGAGSVEGGSVTAKIEQLKIALDQSSLEGSERKEVEAELKALQGRLNFSTSLSPQNQQVQLDLIYADLSQVEMRILGLEQGGEIEESATDETEEAETTGDKKEKRSEKLEKKLRKLGREIRSLLDNGSITQTFHDELIGRQGRLMSELDLGKADLDSIDGMIQDLNATVDAARLSYIESGEPVDSTDGEAGEDEGSKMIEALRAASSGKSEEQILKALNSSGFIFDDIEELKKEINNGNFPPKDPNLGTLDKLVKFCDTLGLVNEIKGVPWKGEHLLAAFKGATPKVVAMLQAFYPDSNISMTHPAITNKDQWRFGNNITFDGLTFDWTVQKEGSQSTIAVAETVYNDAGTNEVS